MTQASPLCGQKAVSIVQVGILLSAKKSELKFAEEQKCMYFCRCKPFSASHCDGNKDMELGIRTARDSDDS
jgi:hypothetical protein